MKRRTTALLLSGIYLIVGNVAAIEGMHNPSNGFLNSPVIYTFFAPYSFVAGMSAFAGWDWLSFVLEAIIFIITIPFFYSMLVVLTHIRQRINKRPRK